MQIAVIHPTLSVYGGAEYVLLTILKCLAAENYRITLISTGTNNALTKEIMKYTRTLILRPKILPYTLAHIVNLATRARKKLNNNKTLIIDTGCLYSPYINCDIGYIHFPMFYQHIYLRDSILYKIYGSLLRNIAATLTKKGKVLQPCILIFNSEYTLKLTEHLVHEETFSYLYDWLRGAKHVVLNPPIQSSVLYQAYKLKYKQYKKNIVATLCRIEPFKRIDDVIDIADKIINEYRFENIKFIIMGRVQNITYYRNLKRKIKSRKLDNYVLLMPNVTEKTKSRILGVSKILLHTARHEHFGIAVLEALAYGLVPIVHSSGGPKFLCKEVGIGATYESLEEASEKILKILHNWRDLSLNVIEKLKNTFSEEVFCNRFLNYIDYCINNR